MVGSSNFNNFSQDNASNNGQIGIEIDNSSNMTIISVTCNNNENDGILISGAQMIQSRIVPVN